MSITFYRAPFSSATPVATALAELGLPHEAITFDLKKGEQRQPEFLQLNPNGKVPTLVVDGQPLFEALAILQWLGDRYGVQRGLWPEPKAPERLRALSWTTWAYVTFGSALGRLWLATAESAPAELKSTAAAERAKSELHGFLGLIESELKARSYLLGEDYSLADLVLANTVHYAGFFGVKPAPGSRTEQWLERCMARPALRNEWGL